MRDEALYLLREHDERHRTMRVRGAEVDQDKYLVDQVSVPRMRERDPMISQLLQTQQQLQTQMLQLISQQKQTQQQLQAVLDHLQPGRAVRHPFAISTGINFRDSSCFVCKEQGTSPVTVQSRGKQMRGGGLKRAVSRDQFF